MNTLLVVLALATCVAAEEWTVKTREQRKQITEECLQEQQLNNHHREHIGNAEYPNDHIEIAQFILCKALKHGFYTRTPTEKGILIHIHTDRIAKQYAQSSEEEERVRKLVEECNKNIKDQNEIAVFNLFICLKDDPVFKN